MITIETKRIPCRDDLLKLYADAGWTAYTDHLDQLERGVARSLAVYTAWEGETLIGLLRAVGDGETILYLQDLLVSSSHRRRGIGRELLERMTVDYPQVRQKVLLTDAADRRALDFYQACGWTRAEELGCTALLGWDRNISRAKEYQSHARL